MPYNSVSELPANVKKLPAKRQRQWMHIYNACAADGKSESKCFAMANGVATKDFSPTNPPTPEEAELIWEAKDYQYVDSYEYSDHALPQTSANYNPTGGTPAESCANCQFWIAPSRCSVVQGTISPTGHSDLWHAQVPYKMDPMPVTIVGAVPTAYAKSVDDIDSIDPDAEFDLVEVADEEPDAFIVSAQMVDVDGQKETLTSSKRNKLPSSSFAWVDSKGKGHLPINDASHTRAAMSRWNQTQFDSASTKSAAKRKIIAAAKRFGIEVREFASSKDGGPFETSLHAAATLSQSGLLARLKELVANPVTGGSISSRNAGSAHPPTVQRAQAFSVVKQKDGRARFYTVWSNNFKDREGEIFTKAAHKEFVDWATETGEYPELWLWHTAGSEFGQVDWLDATDDGFVHASGLIHAGKEALAEQLANQEVGVSHGFFGLQQGNLIHWYRSYELSVLPLQNAAVWTTSFNLLNSGKASEMAFTAEKRKFFTDMGFEDAQIKEWEAKTDGLAGALKGLGLESKAADLGVETPPPPSPEEVADADFRKETTKALMAIQDTMAILAGAVKEIQDKTKDIKSGDAVVAAAMTPPVSGAVVQASKAADNVVGEKSPEADASRDFFQNTVLGSLIGANGAS